MLSFPSSSHHLPILPREQSTRDERREITAWRCLVWAFADEIVQAASNIGSSWYAATGYSQSNFDRERIGGGTINGWYEPHPDALVIHSKLCAWFHHDGVGLAQVMKCAERRELPAPEISLPRVKAVPVYDRNGNVLIEKRRAGPRGRVIAEWSVIEWEGLRIDIAEAREQRHRESYALFVAFLDAMPGFELKRWKVQGRGLTSVDESLTR
jgi:hypothetical protein